MARPGADVTDKERRICELSEGIARSAIASCPDRLGVATLVGALILVTRQCGPHAVDVLDSAIRALQDGRAIMVAMAAARPEAS